MSSTRLGSLSSRDLPYVVWTCIAEYLSSDLLRALAEAEGLFDDTVRSMFAIQADRHAYRLWSRSEQQHKHRIEHPWHNLLFQILTGRLPPGYVHHIDGDETCNLELFACSPFTLEEEQLVRNAVHGSKFVLAEERDLYVNDILLGDEDKVLCLLLPLLPELREIVVPINVQSLPKIISRIATAITTTVECTRVLSKLLVVSCRAYNGNDYGMNLETAVPFAALPSVRRLIFHCNRDDDVYEWPTYMPKSHVTEVYFTQSTTSKRAIESFARGFRGPCTMALWFGRDSSSDPWDATYDWNRCIIANEGDDPVISLGSEELAEFGHEESQMPEFSNWWSPEFHLWSSIARA